MKTQLPCRLAGTIWSGLSGRDYLAGTIWPGLSGRDYLAGTIWQELSGRDYLAGTIFSLPSDLLSVIINTNV